MKKKIQKKTNVEISKTREIFYKWKKFYFICNKNRKKNIKSRVVFRATEERFCEESIGNPLPSKIEPNYTVKGRVERLWNG